MKLKIVYGVIGLVFVISAMSSWQLWQSKSKHSAFEIEETHHHNHEDEHDQHEENVIHLSSQQMEDAGVKTKIAGSGELSAIISTRGKIVLHPDKLAHILPKISGVATETLKNIGDHVKEGEILAVIESREMADIKSNYLATKEKMNLTLSNFEREERLYKKKVSSEQEYLNAKSAYEEAKINFQLARQKLHSFGVNDNEILGLSIALDPNLRLYDIRSPMEGIVISRHITKGEFIESTTTIYEIADLSTIWIEIGVYPRDLEKVKEGQLVNISLPGNEKMAQAKIIYLSPIIQDETITAKAIAEIKNPGENWRPGSFVKANILAEKILAPIVVSREAIQEIEGNSYVFIKIPEGFECRQVKTGEGDDENIVILSGLSPGDEYASSKTFILKADLKKEEAEHEH